MGGSGRRTEQEAFAPFVPRLVADWVAEVPEQRYRQIEGSMVFTDLSGFTTMSEKLATLGRVGAEELTQHLDVVFTELLEVAGGYGASLLKFGGDSLLLFLWGADHELRAAAAAVAMQRRLKKVGVIRTSAGRIRLSMTVGVHAGAFDFFLVGETHRELLVCGPDATRTVVLEASAQPGQVIASGAITKAARKLGPAAVGPRRGRGVQLLRAPRGVKPGEVVEGAWPTSLRPGDHVPALLREEIRGGVVPPEHRQMVVGFVHLTNVDALLSHNGPGTTADALDALMAELQSVFAEHGVGFVSSDIYDDGPKLICSVGAIRSWENDDERMLRALREVLDLDTPVAMRAGVHRGHGFRGPIGPPWRRTFAVMGDVVNTAARVMAKSGQSELLSTPGVVGRSDTRFATQELPPFAAKGKAEPLVAHRVGEVIGVRDRLAGSFTPLVGRERELDELLGRVSSIKDGIGNVTEVVGEAGIGKSRLLDELAHQVGSWARVERSHSGRYAQASAYLPLRPLMAAVIGGGDLAALATAVDESAPALEVWIPLLGVPLGLEIEATPEVAALDPEFARNRLEQVVCDLLVARIDEPSLWLLEDIHWADDATLSLLGALCRRIADLPLAVVASCRRDGGRIPGATAVDVEPLDGGAAAELIRSASKLPLLPAQVAELAERAEGHPLFLEELTAAANEGQDLLPETVEGLIAARIDALDAKHRRAIRHLAVLGLSSDIDTVRAVVEELVEPTDARAWRPLERFVERQGNTVRFRHALTRDVAYQGLSFQRRSTLHLAAGRYLEALPDAPMELLALHFFEGGDAERAYAYARTAGEQAEQRYAYREAAAFWARAEQACARLGRRPDDRCGALLRQGEALRKAARLVNAEAVFRKARRVRRVSPSARAELALRIAKIVGLTDRRHQAADWYRRALAEARQIGGPILGEALVAFAIHLRDVGLLSDAQQYNERALDQFEKSAGGRSQAYALAVALRFVLVDVTGTKDIDLLARATTKMIDELGEKRVLSTHINSVAQAHKRRGNWELATTLTLKAAALCRACGDDLNAAVTQNNLGELFALRGEASLALAAFSDAREAFEAAGIWAQHAAALGEACALVRSGQADAGAKLIERSNDALTNAGIPLFAETAALNLAEASLRRGDVGTANKRLGPLHDSDDPEIRLSALRMQAYGMFLLGEGHEAIAMLRRAATESTAHAYHRAIALDALASWDDDHQAAREVTATFRRLGVVLNPEASIWSEAQLNMK